MSEWAGLYSRSSRSTGVPEYAIQRHMSVREGAPGRLVVDRRGLRLEPRKLPLEVGDEHVRHVVREAAPDDYAQRGEVGPVLRERVRRHLPAALAQRVRDVEDGVVLDLLLQREREHGKLVAARQELERPDLGDPPGEPRRDVARVSLHAPEAVVAEPKEVVVLRDDLRAGS